MPSFLQQVGPIDVWDPPAMREMTYTPKTRYTEIVEFNSKTLDILLEKLLLIFTHS